MNIFHILYLKCLQNILTIHLWPDLGASEYRGNPWLMEVLMWRLAIHPTTCMRWSMITTQTQGAFLNQISHWIHIRFVFDTFTDTYYCACRNTELSSCKFRSLNNRIALLLSQNVFICAEIIMNFNPKDFLCIFRRHMPSTFYNLYNLFIKAWMFPVWGHHHYLSTLCL